VARTGGVHVRRSQARRVVGAVVAAAMVALALGGPLGSSASATPQTSTDATCSQRWLGDYQKPKGITAAFVGDGLGSRDDADGPRYRLQVTGTGPYTLTVRRTSDGAVVLTTQAGGGNTGWGFSPDQDGFLVTEGGNGVTDPFAFRLYDLAAGNLSAPLLQQNSNDHDLRLGWSPHGEYFVYDAIAQNTQDEVALRVYDAHDGDLRVQTQTRFAINPTAGNKDFRGAGWGFSPDDDEFVYTWVETAPQGVAYRLVDLDAGLQRYAGTFTHDGWSLFSPRGDYLAVVEQYNPSSTDVTLIGTHADADVHTPWHGDAVAATTLESTASGEVVHFGSNTYGLLGHRPPVPDYCPPTWGDASELTASDITPSSVHLLWSGADDDTAVTAYRVLSRLHVNPPAAAGPWTELADLGAVPGYDATDLAPATTYDVRVEARDAAGHWSTDGPATTVTTAPVPATLSGAVFLDVDVDGVQGDDEPAPLPVLGAIGTLCVGPSPSGCTALGADGNGGAVTTFGPLELTPGTTYAVHLTLSSGWHLTTPLPTTIDGSDGTQVLSIGVRVDAGKVEGVVFDDKDHDGVQGAGEPPMQGVVVAAMGIIDPATGAPLTTDLGSTALASTDADGHYAFVSLPSRLSVFPEVMQEFPSTFPAPWGGEPVGDTIPPGYIAYPGQAAAGIGMRELTLTPAKQERVDLPLIDVRPYTLTGVAAAWRTDDAGSGELGVTFDPLPQIPLPAADGPQPPQAYAMYAVAATSQAEAIAKVAADDVQEGVYRVRNLTWPGAICGRGDGFYYPENIRWTVPPDGGDVIYDDVCHIPPQQVDPGATYLVAVTLWRQDQGWTDPYTGIPIQSGYGRTYTGAYTVVPLAPNPFPGVPTIGTATARDGAAVLTWTPPSFPGSSAITGYRITVTDYSLDPADPGFVTTRTAAAGAKSLVVTGLTNGHDYAFAVAAGNHAGYGGLSDPSEWVTPCAACGSVEAPVVATTTTLTVTGQRVFGQHQTLAATVSPAAVGTVRFTDGSTTLGTARVTGGSAHVDVSLAVGSHTVKAAFVPTDAAAFGASTSTSQVVTIARATLRTAVPTISGTAKVGVKLTAKPGTWTAGTAFTYQWFANGKAVKGATKSTFVPAAAQKGATLKVRVTGTRTGYASTATTSKATKKVAAGVLTSRRPTISGTAKTGKKLTAKHGTWTSGTTFTYRWYAGGKAIAGATHSTLTLKAAQRGKTITVKVTGEKSGYTAVTVASRATKKVAR